MLEAPFIKDFALEASLTFLISILGRATAPKLIPEMGVLTLLFSLSAFTLLFPLCCFSTLV